MLKCDWTIAPTFIALWPLKTLLDSYAMQHHHRLMPEGREMLAYLKEDLVCTRYFLHSAYKNHPCGLF